MISREGDPIAAACLRTVSRRERVPRMRKRNSSVAVVLGKAWLAAMLATGMVSGLPGDLHAASIPGDVGEEVTCSIAHRLPANFEVYHVGTYGGTSPLGQFIELDNSGHEVKKADVLVNYPDRAIVLVLSAYDPVVWNLAWVPGSTIVGVVLSGYHGQAIVGIPKSIPLILTTYENQVRKPASSGRHCPYFYTYRVDQEYRKTNDLIMAMTGKEVTRFIAAPPKSIALVGTELPPSFANLMSSPYYALGDFTMVRKPDEVPAGPR